MAGRGCVRGLGWPPAVVSMQQAQEAVAAVHPEFVPTTVIAEHGVLRVTDFELSYTVDPARRGARRGRGADLAGWTENLHMCLLSCEDYPGYLEAPVPGTAWLGHEGEPVTVGGLILGVFGVLLLFLGGFRVVAVVAASRPVQGVDDRASRQGPVRPGHRPAQGDRHDRPAAAAGLGFTGAGFELGVVEDAWYALTPGSHVESAEAVSADGEGPDIGPDIGVDAAAAAAFAVVPGATLAAVDIAVPDEPSAVYTVWVADGVDPYAHGDYPGDVAVAVDRRTAATTITYGTAEESVAQTIWVSWNYPVHADIVVNGWWRIIWFVLGLAPLALAVTGVSTRLVRRKARRERLARQPGPTRQPSAPTSSTAVPVSDADSMSPTQ